MHISRPLGQRCLCWDICFVCVSLLDLILFSCDTTLLWWDSSLHCIYQVSFWNHLISFLFVFSSSFTEAKKCSFVEKHHCSLFLVWCHQHDHISEPRLLMCAYKLFILTNILFLVVPILIFSCLLRIRQTMEFLNYCSLKRGKCPWSCWSYLISVFVAKLHGCVNERVHNYMLY